MANAWTENGPVSLPPRWLVYAAAAIVASLALLGVGMGIKAAWRDAGAPDLGGPADASGEQGVLTAKPIVETPPPVTAPDTGDADATNAADAEQAKEDAIAAKAAAAQEIQAKSSKAAGNIDDILASPTEKPPASVKPAADEAPPPGAPVKTDVPF